MPEQADDLWKKLDKISVIPVKTGERVIDTADRTIENSYLDDLLAELEESM